MARNRKAAPAGGSDKTRLYVVLGVVAVLAVGAVAYSVGSNALGEEAVAAPVPITGADDPARLVELAQGVTMGNADAPITIIEFGDYQCPGCGQFAQQVKPRIELAYLNGGEARFVFYDFPLVQIHPNAFLAARAARCAGDADRYWEYHDALFRNQASWSGRSDPLSSFVDYAAELGIDEGGFESCLRSDRHAEVVSANMRLGEELGVSGTPTVMISQGRGMARRVQNFDFGSIQDVVEELKQGG